MTGTQARRDLRFWLGIVVALALGWFFGDLLHRWVLAASTGDEDGPWHLACGRLIVETGAVPRTDPFCFTTGGLDWVNLNWLAQVVLFRLDRAYGLEGPLALSSAMFALGVSLTGLACRGRPSVRLVGFVITAGTVLLVRGIRPQIITFALFAAIVALLQAPAPGETATDPDPAPALGPWRLAGAGALLLLWDHLHGGFVWGWCLLGADALGSAIVTSLRAGGPRLPRRAVECAGLIGLGMLGFAAHPHGFAALEHALLYLRRLGPDQLARVVELQPLGVTSATDRAALAYAAALLLGWALARRAVRAQEVVVGLLFLVQMLAIRRSSTALVLSTAPSFVRCWSVALGRARPLARPLELLDAVLRPAALAAPWALLAATMLWIAVWVPRRAHPGEPGDPTDPGWDRSYLPCAVVAHLRARGGSERVFGEYTAGGMLDWALGPTGRVFMDGRGDLHGRGHGYADYLAIVDLTPGWEERLRRADVGLAVQRADSPIARALRGRGWRVADEADGWQLLERPPAEER
jgi:hypothetical protein